VHVTNVVDRFLVENQPTASLTLVSLAILLVGISLLTLSDVQVNLPGTIVATFVVVFVVCVAASQTKTGTMQNDSGITDLSAQHATAFL
jgi:hypothetical protein